jgi:hypothetical protein
MCWSKPAIKGMARAIAALTAGKANEAWWLSALSQTSVIQMPSASAGSSATT